MYYKRNEPFRYTFGQPLKTLIEMIKKEDTEETLTSDGQWEALLLDISPNGMKIISATNIDFSEDTQIRISFRLNETQFEINGTISWKKFRGLNFEYGIVENNSEGIKDLLISELKTYSKNISKKH